MQNEELTVLKTIFEDAVHIPELYASPKVVLEFELPDTYPVKSPPTIKIIAQHLSGQQIQWMHEEMENLYQIGSPVLFECVEWVREHEELYTQQVKKHQKISEPIPQQDEAYLEALNSLTQKIVHGESFVERKSTFQAHICEVHCLEDVKLMMEALIKNTKIRNATHNILAYRIVNPDTKSILQDFDDDGETAAGSRLLHLLQITKVENVAICVSRWFGNILLGPSRFAHINNAARDLLAQCGYL